MAFREAKIVGDNFGPQPVKFPLSKANQPCTMIDTDTFFLEILAHTLFCGLKNSFYKVGH